jgi:hypothetical protein
LSYTTPPTFVDGNLGSAAQLNILADDIKYLANISNATNIPFRAVWTDAGVTVQDTGVRWKIRHLHRYFHYRVRQTDSTSDFMEVHYDSTTVYSDGGDRVAAYTWEGYVDLEDTGVITPTPTIGEWYDVKIENGHKTGSGRIAVDYLLESDSTTI